MTPSRPYFIRAVHGWLVDNALTPQLLVDAKADGVQVPSAYVQDGRIVLNVSVTAVRDLVLGNDCIEFSARFGGTPHDIVVPTRAVLAVYARENGIGMAFQESGEQEDGPTDPPDESPPRPRLRVVK